MKTRTVRVMEQKGPRQLSQHNRNDKMAFSRKQAQPTIQSTCTVSQFSPNSSAANTQTQLSALKYKNTKGVLPSPIWK